jgi:hypothetical protein
MFVFWLGEQFIYFGIWTWTNLRTKWTAERLLQGPTVWVELSLGLNMGGLNVKAPSMSRWHQSLHWERHLLHGPTAGRLSTLWFIASSSSFSVTAAVLCGRRSYGFLPGDCPAWRRNLLQPIILGLAFRGYLAVPLLAPLTLPPIRGNRWWDELFLIAGAELGCLLPPHACIGTCLATSLNKDSLVWWFLPAMGIRQRES